MILSLLRYGFVGVDESRGKALSPPVAHSGFRYLQQAVMLHLFKARA